LIKRRKFPKIFFGWWTVLAGGILGLWVSGFHVWGAAVMFKPIASALGFTRAQTAIPTAIGRLEGGIEGPLAGWIADRFGPRWIVLSGIFLAGLSLILMYYVNSLWAYCLVWGVLLGTAHNISTTIPIQTAISNWFVKKRGLALAIQNTMNGSAGVTVLPLIGWLVFTQDWRMTCVIGGVIILVVGLPLAWFFLKQHRPEYYGLLPDGATVEEEEAETSQMIDKGIEYATEVEEVEFTLRQAMRTPALWLLIVAQATHGLSVSAVNIHSIPLLTDMGIDPLRAATIVAICYAGCSLPSRLVGGFLADHLSKRRLRFILIGAYLLGALGFAAFLWKQTIAMIYVFLTLAGISKGAAMAPFAAVEGRYFGRKSFGSIRGVSMMFMTPFGILAPIYGGWVYDTTGSYIEALTLCAALLSFAMVITVFALPPKPPAQVTDIHKLV